VNNWFDNVEETYPPDCLVEKGITSDRNLSFFVFDESIMLSTLKAKYKTLN